MSYTLILSQFNNILSRKHYISNNSNTVYGKLIPQTSRRHSKVEDIIYFQTRTVHILTRHFFKLKEEQKYVPELGEVGENEADCEDWERKRDGFPEAEEVSCGTWNPKYLEAY